MMVNTWQHHAATAPNDLNQTGIFYQFSLILRTVNQHSDDSYKHKVKNVVEKHLLLLYIYAVTQRRWNIASNMFRTGHKKLCWNKHKDVSRLPACTNVAPLLVACLIMANVVGHRRRKSWWLSPPGRLLSSSLSLYLPAEEKTQRRRRRRVRRMSHRRPRRPTVGSAPNASARTLRVPTYFITPLLWHNFNIFSEEEASVRSGPGGANQDVDASGRWGRYLC